ncbi:LytR C-terminal domain-containing protein [Micromonospora sp. CPCC 206061]|uniref:LytR C-terminal domain-containing protein n=1 Tax=Micromonospora sp. CPCC 206061 TaxID=3122410 RepID=UPI002FF2EFA5
MTVVADDQADGASAGCAPGQPYADTEIRQEDKITIAVFNGTDRAGVAAAVAADLRDRGFKAKAEKDDPKHDDVSGVGMVRFGPEGVGSAQVVRAYLFGEATREYDPDRRGAVVDLVVGKDFQELARLTDKNIALADIGQPEAPAGTCERPTS